MLIDSVYNTRVEQLFVHSWIIVAMFTVYVFASSSVFKLLRPINYNRLRLATGTFRISLVLSLRAEANDPLFQNRFFLRLMYSIRVCSVPQHPLLIT